MSDTRLVKDQKEWQKVAADLESENIKLAYYDGPLLELLGSIASKDVLDFGAGPGVLALALSKLGASVKVWDISEEMRAKAAERIGAANVYDALEYVPVEGFDIVINNLVQCIVPEAEVKQMVRQMSRALKSDGTLYIGFCNPLIFKLEESQLDLRFPTGDAYDTNHDYKKIKKEGGYEIIETHRPIEWYEQVFALAGLTLVAKHFTPEYELGGQRIQDFIIFELRKQV